MKIPRTVYAIQHNETKKIYIGSSTDVEKRYWSHIYQLRRQKHSVEDMQKDFNDYGENYSLFVLEEINSFEERNKEYEWMEKLKTHIRSIGYNYKDHAKAMKDNKRKLPLRSGIPKSNFKRY